jgi:hypothetical protein
VSLGAAPRLHAATSAAKPKKKPDEPPPPPEKADAPPKRGWTGLGGASGAGAEGRSPASAGDDSRLLVSGDEGTCLAGSIESDVGIT